MSYAELIYIKIGKTLSKNKLQSVNSQLKSIGLNMNYTSKNKKYTIYSGPYKNHKIAKRNLQKIKKYFPNASIVAKSQSTKSEKSDESFFNGVFVGASIGYSSFSATHNLTEGTVTPKMPKDTALNYELNIGYYFTDEISISIAYSMHNASSLKITNIYSSIDYQYKLYEDVKPFIGLLAGHSKLKWEQSPIDEKGTSLNTSTFGGAEIGFKYSAISDFELYSAYQFMLINHETKLQPSTGSSTIEHKSLHNLLFGIKYNF